MNKTDALQVLRLAQTQEAAEQQSHQREIDQALKLALGVARQHLAMLQRVSWKAK